MRVFEIVRDLTGAPLPRRLPYALAAAAARFEEARARLTGRPPLITRGVVEILRHDWSMDSRRSIAELGYRITSLESGVTALVRSLSSFVHPVRDSDSLATRAARRPRPKARDPADQGLGIRDSIGPNHPPQPPSNQSDAANGRRRGRAGPRRRQRSLSGAGGTPQPRCLQARAPDDGHAAGCGRRGAGDFLEGLQATEPVRVQGELRHVAAPDRGELLDRLDPRAAASRVGARRGGPGTVRRRRKPRRRPAPRRSA